MKCLFSSSLLNSWIATLEDRARMGAVCKQDARRRIRNYQAILRRRKKKQDD